MTVEDLILDLQQHVDIKATPEKAFAAVLHRLGKGNTRPDGQSLNMQLEPKPGGRWFRDLDNGVGHFWGYVQVIKPPALLELSGPMFMSYPAINHVEVKLEAAPGGCGGLRHRALGFIDPQHRKRWSARAGTICSPNAEKDCE